MCQRQWKVEWEMDTGRSRLEAKASMLTWAGDQSKNRDSDCGKSVNESDRNRHGET